MISSIVFAIGVSLGVSADQGYEFPKGIIIREYNDIRIREVTEVSHAPTLITEQDKYIHQLYREQFKRFNPHSYFDLTEKTKAEIKPLKQGKPLERFSVQVDPYFMDRFDK
ncbi:hypothetical protein [Shewanella aestuarii]|uniref:Uncharacterized protein n=1 Tax=Shewanella aestuarii TaxID=1028752 RepID=A0A6G9QPQ1_9GAMM|nr:hypothetical protein [Shewanella aestuarii]QIR16398.1 hypothetical protein HBH39_18140 [Shewanella aestuarii]